MKRVIVVGAGIIGLFCAIRLTQSGARVTLIEGQPENLDVVSATASAAAAGMLAPLGEMEAPHQQIGFASLDLWRTWSTSAVWRDGVRFDGGVMVAESADAASALAQAAERVGRSAKPISSGDFRKRTGFNARVENALFVEDEGLADPLRVMSGLVFEARRLGVTLLFDHDAADVTATSVTLHNDEVLEADAVVLAPGAWAPEKFLKAATALTHIQPAKGHLVSVTLEKALKPNLRVHGFYIAQRLEDVVLGATMEFGTYQRSVSQERVDELLAAAEKLLPGEVKPRGRAWAGIRPMSPDGAPMIGPDVSEILLAAGHSRNGWLLAPITAEIISAYVFGAEIAPEWAALSPARFGNP